MDTWPSCILKHRFSIVGLDRQGLGFSSRCSGDSITFLGSVKLFINKKFSQLPVVLDKCKTMRIHMRPWWKRLDCEFSFCL
jgi:hypothetical protein